MKKFLTLLSLTAALGVCATHAADAPEASIVVAQDGSGDYTRVQDAVNAAPTNRTARTIIYIKPGTYKEKIVVPSDRPNLMFVGQSHENTILTYDDYAGKTRDYASTPKSIRTCSNTTPTIPRRKMKRLQIIKPSALHPAGDGGPDRLSTAIPFSLLTPFAPVHFNCPFLGLTPCLCARQIVS